LIKKVEDHLPKKAPKKTGKRGIKPLDIDKDFPEPVKKEPAKHAPESLMVEQPKRPTVVGDRFEAFYLKPVFGKTKDGKKTIGLRFTVPLENEHEGLLPKIIHDGYRDIRKTGRVGMRFNNVPGQRAEIFLTHDIKEDALVLPAAKFLTSKIDIVERKGEGESRKVIRLSFMLQVEHSREVAHFADYNYGNNFWLCLEETEESLFDEDEED